jgi:hypothetical protein
MKLGASCAAIALLVCVLVQHLVGGAEHARPEQAVAPVGAVPVAANLSCSTAACHNAGSGADKPGSEFTIWANHDPHANAFLPLLDSRSDDMVRRLQGRDATPAHRTVLCLRCHADPVSQATVAGTGCTSCHGTGAWVTAHTRPGWIKHDTSSGLAPLWRLDRRVDVCMRCHIGSADAEVNHDLIAAGHPPLRFEFGSYFANLPRHWPESGRESETERWAVGQTKSAQAALALLEHRARKGVWPEFAEYNCYDCHHDLKNDSWRRERRVTGTVRWGSWYCSDMSLLSVPVGALHEKVVQERDAIRKAMQKLPADRHEVKAKVAALRVLLDVSKSDSDPNRLLERIRSHSASPPPDWEEAAQTYLALAALRRERPTRGANAANTKSLERLMQTLQYSENDYQSPRDFDPARFQRSLIEFLTAP